MEFATIYSLDFYFRFVCPVCLNGNKNYAIVIYHYFILLFCLQLQYQPQYQQQNIQYNRPQTPAKQTLAIARKPQIPQYQSAQRDPEEQEDEENEVSITNCFGSLLTHRPPPSPRPVLSSSNRKPFSHSVLYKLKTIHQF